MTANRPRLAWLPFTMTVVVILATGVAGWWLLMMPKIKTASAEEVRKQLPAELNAMEPVDPAALERGKKVLAELAAMKPDLPDLSKVATDHAGPSGLRISPSSNPAEDWPVEPADQFVSKDSAHLSRLKAILQSGPIATPLPKPFSFPGDEAAGAERFESAISWCAKVLAKNGKSREAEELLGIAIALADRSYWASTGSLIDNMVAAAAENIAAGAVSRIVRTGRATPDECRRLLAALPPVPETDEVLSKAIREDFRLSLLPIEQDPAGGGLGVKPSPERVPEGTYDPIETAKIEGQVKLIEMRNARRPLSKFDRSGLKLADREAAGVPPLISDDEVSSDTPAPSPSLWDKLKTRYVMDSGRNTLGRQLIGGTVLDDGEVRVSCRWRARREVTRVLLAAKIYASENGGKYPADTAGFVSILGSWPMDPFDGKPMRYNAAKEVVYSVGEDLKDDGGMVDGAVATDIGISLRSSA